MNPLLECVPNFSEGRDDAVLDALREAGGSVQGTALLDVHADRFHHRSVFTLAGDPEGLAEAAFRMVRVAVDRIDLRSHRGEHPRIGAADVVPFVPLRGMEMPDAVAVAEATGERIARELGVPVYLYGEAARRPGRRVLAAIRRGGFEGLSESVETDPARAPDIGPARLHPSAGATSVGARGILVAYNVFLGTEDVKAARAIAREIRSSSGGLPALQALGFRVEGRSQVSMNLLDVDRTPPVAAFREIRRRAAALEVEVDRSEIVGLVPERALSVEDAREIRLEGSREERLLERRIEEELKVGRGDSDGEAG
jgi:glutamate formiminotransferase